MKWLDKSHANVCIFYHQGNVGKREYGFNRLENLRHMSSYPPMKALLAFDAAMRHHSFALAANDLAVTPGAISQQVQKLEEWLSTALFVRDVRQIRPTAQASAYWKTVGPALTSIQQASQQVRTPTKKEVHISMPPSFAAKWFAPRMADFMARHPDIALHLEASPALLDFERDGVDLAVRYFDGANTHLDSSLLFRDEARLFCAPGYAKQLRLKKPADLARATLLHITQHAHWGIWLETFAHLGADQIARMPGLHFNQTLLAIEAAKHGRGAVLCGHLLVEDELMRGQLMEPFIGSLELPHAYYMVHAKAARLRPPVKALKAWLQEMSAEQIRSPHLAPRRPKAR